MINCEHKEDHNGNCYYCGKNLLKRIIKFRIWDDGKKVWVHDTEHAVNLLGETIIMGEILRRPDDTGVTLEELNNLVVMQFTGHRDKNGRDIFEDDIIEIEMNISRDKHRELVEWDYAENGWNDWNVYCPKYVEVIGNIHENPDLL